MKNVVRLRNFKVPRKIQLNFRSGYIRKKTVNILKICNIMCVQEVILFFILTRLLGHRV